jgi:flagellin
MVITTNIAAQISADNLSHSQSLLTKSLARLSSGAKIVNPGDDAGGLAVSTRLDAQVQRLDAAKSNVSDAVSFTQTQDGYLKNVGKALGRMSELAILSMDATKTDTDRGLYDQEYQQLSGYINEASTKDFNGVSLFSTTALSVTTDSEGNTISMSGIDMSTNYSAATGSNVANAANAATALTNIKSAITVFSQDRATVGAYQSRLDYTSQQLVMSKENLAAASSTIKDVDVAEESTAYAKANILQQAGTAMLAQANQVPQGVLKLLQG